MTTLLYTLLGGGRFTELAQKSVIDECSEALVFKIRQSLIGGFFTCKAHYAERGIRLSGATAGGLGGNPHNKQVSGYMMSLRKVYTLTLLAKFW